MLRCASSLLAVAYAKVRLTPRYSRALPAAFLRSRPIFRVFDFFSRSSFIEKGGSLRRRFVPREGHPAQLKRLDDLLFIGLLIVEGDADRVLLRTPEVDDPAHTLEDRTYPRIGASFAAAGNIQFYRLFRRSDRRGDYQEQRENGRETDNLRYDHHPHTILPLFFYLCDPDKGIACPYVQAVSS
jgi:hypothetical protein